MMTLIQFTEEKWFSYLEPRLQVQVKLSEQLFAQATQMDSKLSDYSYLVFPMAKAYEGFLKQFFLDLKLISQKVFVSRRFRIGRSLNPDVNPRHRDEYWLFDDIARVCGQELARDLWNAWLECRNRLFHFFPSGDGSLSLNQATQKLDQLSQVMTRALTCELIQSKLTRNLVN